MTGALLIRLHKLHRAALASRISAIGLYPGQDGLLYYLSMSNKPLTMGELAERLGVSAPTVTSMVAKLAKAGLVLARKSSSDQRVTYVRLSASGKRKVRELGTIWNSLESVLTRGMSKADRQAVEAGLERLINNLKP